MRAASILLFLTFAVPATGESGPMPREVRFDAVGYRTAPSRGWA
jgi:hypothetical protein